ncbi:hypothetical protein EVAR_97823_1 [Eumeta japonica]|uniref:Uncharacterized protein n=1 Tax=Eumeta variegata TaxID=151549 RepID=A0A4C1X9S9_EUMVA|nr:hypothetical protein EVAR_97818_1 [Eumeta japonica]GBP60568.1 hypothetical protein EVAR_97823_1 [Eumeta japonica]
MCKKFFDMASNDPSPLLVSAVSKESPLPITLLKGQGKVLSDPPDNLTAELESYQQLDALSTPPGIPNRGPSLF